MTSQILGVTLIFILVVVFGIPLGKYIAKIFKGEKIFLDFMTPLENFIFKLCRINPNAEMNWKENMRALLMINLIWFIYGMIVMVTQGIHPFWNPDNIAFQEPTLAFNTVTSFVTNTNLQHYSGESGASYFSQILFLAFMQFVSAATGMAAVGLLFKGLANKSGSNLGNFYNLFLKSCTRILLPISMVIGIILMLNSQPMTFEGASTIVNLEGDTVNVATGPVAAMIPIKELGTNGGGFFGANSAHPFENPNFITNIVENWAMMVIPIAMVFALGYYLNRKKLSYMIFYVMTAGFLVLVIPTMILESKGNPDISKMGISQPLGSMEGKEVRFGPVASAYWGIANTVISCGSVNSMHDSWTALSGMFPMLGMHINSFYGGVGVGILNMFIFIIITVFIAGLMVGRTPEFLCKKIESKEVKIAIIVTLIPPLLMLAFTAISSHLWASDPNASENLKWLNNPSYHGFSEMFYEFTSSSANNGSGFEGLADNTPFWNILCGLCMMIVRFIPIIGPIAIAGLLSEKKCVPETSGTLRTDSLVFGITLFSLIIITVALLFFPSLVLGPIAEYLSVP